MKLMKIQDPSVTWAHSKDLAEALGICIHNSILYSEWGLLNYIQSPQTRIKPHCHYIYLKQYLKFKSFPNIYLWDILSSV